MHGIEHNGHEERTLLEVVLQLHVEFRRNLEPIRVTPLQAGVMLFLRRHADARVTDAATALRVRQPTMVEVVKDLVRKRWVTNCRLVEDRRTVCLRRTRQGQVLARKIESQVQQVSTGVAANKDLTAAGLTRLHRVSSSTQGGIIMTYLRVFVGACVLLAVMGIVVSAPLGSSLAIAATEKAGQADLLDINMTTVDQL